MASGGFGNDENFITLSSGQQTKEDELTPLIIFKNMLLFPNPSAGQLILVVNEGDSVEVFIYNNLGALVYSQTANSTQQINLSSHPKGIYFVKAQSADMVFTEKLILQ